MCELKASITELWERRAQLGADDLEAKRVVEEVIGLLDSGEIRVAEVNQATDEVVVHEWVKQAILMLFRLREMESTVAGPFEFLDRIPMKSNYGAIGVRVVPGGMARWGSYLAPGVVLMPSYVNIGARVEENTMVDTWATVGSCAQVGKRVHISGGVGIGGVLEPPQAQPVIIEDDVMLASRCMITEGARVGQGSVIGAGVILNPSIPVIDAQTGLEVSRGIVPPWCVAVSASRKRSYPGGEFYLPCVLIIRRLNPGERHDKAQLNEILREHSVAI